MISWTRSAQRLLRRELADGSRKKLLEKSRFPAALSPGGAYILSFNADDSQWYTVRVSEA